MKAEVVCNAKPTDMFRNYFKIALRSIFHNKGYSFVNVAGLTLGLAASIVLFLIVRNELSYDRFHEHADHTYRVTVHSLDYNPSVSFAVAPVFRNDFPQTAHVTQYFYRNTALINTGDERFNEAHYAFADEEFPEVFTFEWLAGNPAMALDGPGKVVLTETMAKKYFGSHDVLGKTIRLDNKYDLVVSGVIRDLPSNTHLVFNFLVSWETIRKEVENSNFWRISGGYLYVTLPDHVSAESVADQFPQFITKNWGPEIASNTVLILQPLAEIHFDQRYIAQVSMPRSKESVYGLAGIALFIIFTACINFVNLATTQSLKRAKQVGVRKTLGAFRKQLIVQVLVETSVLVAFSVVLALTIVWFVLPYAEPLLDLRLDAGQLLNPEVVMVILSVTLATIVMAGLYPALMQSRLQPVTALKPAAPMRSQESLFLRKGLVIVQFAITQILLIATIVVGAQMNFFINQDIGFDNEAIITFPTGNNREVLHQELSALPGVAGVSFASGGPPYNTNFAPFSSPESGMMEADVTEIKHVDENYMPMYKLELLAGEGVTKTSRDTVTKVVVNETLIHRLGIQDPHEAIGTRFFVGDDPIFIKGVVRDFQSESKHKKIRSCIIWYNPNAFWQASVKLGPNNWPETLAAIDKMWSRLNPESLFRYEFVDDHMADMYKQEQQMYTAFRLFSGIAIFISCLGLYGLVSLMGTQRTREIGIRKVLGASVSSIVFLFFNQFIWLIIVAFVVAAPVSWYAMTTWLEEFAYHIPIGPVIFAASILITFIIATATISYQSIKTALINPVKSLKV